MNRGPFQALKTYILSKVVTVFNSDSSAYAYYTVFFVSAPWMKGSLMRYHDTLEIMGFKGVTAPNPYDPRTQGCRTGAPYIGPCASGLGALVLVWWIHWGVLSVNHFNDSHSFIQRMLYFYALQIVSLRLEHQIARLRFSFYVFLFLSQHFLVSISAPTISHN